MLLLKTESYRKGVIYSSLFNVTGKSVAFIQQWLIGYYFGMGTASDVFFFTYNIILFLSYFFLNMTTSVLIPSGMRIRNQESDEASRSFFNGFILIYVIIALFVTGVSLFDIQTFFSVVSSFPEEIVGSNIQLIIWCLPIITLNIVVSILTEILASYKYFTAPNLVTFINYVSGVIFIVLFHDKFGIVSVAQGLVLGYLINLAVLLLMMSKNLQWNFLRISYKNTRTVIHAGIFSQAGYIIYLLALYVPQNLFSALPAGSLTAVNFADKILTIPGIFLVTQITNVMGIKINNLVSTNDLSKFSELLHKLLIVVPISLFIVSIAISLSSGFLSELLFSWGKYDANSTRIVSGILATMIFYLPFSFIFGIYTKVYNAFGKQKTFFWLQLLTQGLTILLYLAIIPNHGLYSYPPCRILPYIMALFIGMVPLYGYCPGIKSPRILLCYILVSVLSIGFISVNTLLNVG